MKKLIKTETGFTLIELLIVVIIVAVLVAVGVPLLQGNIERAKMTEADAGLGILRTGLRSRLAEHGSSILPAAPLTTADLGARNRVPNTTPGDLDGRFFSEEAYGGGAAGTLAGVGDTFTPNTFCISLNGALSVAAPAGTINGAVRADEVNGNGNSPTLVRSMDHNGTIFRVLGCTAGQEVN